MTSPIRQKVRCAIYTRVSTDSGLDQDFNSLDARYDAAQAYIRSQAHAGWTLVRTRYDDGGFSGGSTNRPALQQLLDDIRAHRINVIVVYKVDRLTRALADFAKLVKLFDAHGVSFVSVTQQFKSERDSEAQDRRHSVEQDEPLHRDPHTLVVPWKKTPSKRPRETILPASTSSHPDPRPIRAETRAKLVTAIAKGRRWLDELIAGTVTNVDQIAARDKSSIRQVNRTITLVFIAPALVQAAVDGRLPRGVGVSAVRDLPAEWDRQYERLGLTP
jgi:Resolvase, N terminal domain